MKYVTESHWTPTAFTYPGTDPTANSSDPTANRIAIHQPRARGAHQVDPVGVALRCLRWCRDSQRATRPSGRTCSTNVTAEPKPPQWLPRSRPVINASDLPGSVCPANWEPTMSSDNATPRRGRDGLPGVYHC